MSGAGQQSFVFYGYPKCDTCRKAQKELQRLGVSVAETVDLFASPPPREQLAEIIAKSGLPLKSFFNTSGEAYKELGLKDKLAAMSEDEQIDLLASNGRLIKRPIVYDGERVTVGFKQPAFGQAWQS